MKRIITLLAAALIAAGSISAQELANFRGGSQVKSPEMQDGKVTFRLNANYATVVNLSASWIEGAVPMVKGDKGSDCRSSCS